MAQVHDPDRRDQPISGTAAYAWYIVAILSLCHLLSFLDRTIISILLQPIKLALDLSDTGVGFVTGFGFTLLYSLFGLPLGRLVDQFNRQRLILAGVTLWSVSTILCGFATSAWTLFAARMGVGLGEAVLAPAALSLIGNYIVTERLGLASGLFTLGAHAGRTLALIGGGALLIWLASRPSVAIFTGFAPWQVTFLISGLMGLPVIALMLTVHEPLRVRSAAAANANISLRSTLRYVHQNGSAFYPHFLAACAMVGLQQVTGTWTPTFLVRKFGLTAGESGYLFGLMIIAPSILGSLVGGWLADMQRRRGHIDAPVRIAILSLAAAVVPGVLFVVVNDFTVMLVAMGLYLFLSAIGPASTLTGLQILTPVHRRGVTVALFFAVTAIIGFLFGTVAVGVLNDFVFHDESALPQSLAIARVVLTAIGIGAALAGRKAFIRTAARGQD